MSCCIAGADGKVAATGVAASVFSSFAISPAVVACAVAISRTSGVAACTFGLAVTTTGSALSLAGGGADGVTCRTGSGIFCVTRSGQMVFVTGLASIGRAGGGVHVVLHPTVNAARKYNQAACLVMASLRRQVFLAPRRQS